MEKVKYHIVQSITILLLFLLPLGVFSQSYDAYVSAAYKKRLKGDYKAALIEYENAIELNISGDEAYFGRGFSKYHLGDITGAIQDFRKGVSINASSGNYYILALYQEKTEDFNEALLSVNKAIELNHLSNISFVDFRDLFYLRATLHKKTRNYAAAITDYDHAINSAPNVAYLYVDRADVKMLLTDYTAALEDYMKCYKLRPIREDGETEYWFEKQEKRALAGQLDALNKLLAINPKDVDRYFQRGNVKLKLKDYIGAVHDYSKVIDLDADANAFLNRGIAKEGANDYRGAILDYDKAIKLSTSSDAYFLRGGAKYSLKSYQDAIEDFTTAINLNPQDFAAYEYRGLAKIRIGENESGCLDLSKAGELGSKSAYDLIRQYCL